MPRRTSLRESPAAYYDRRGVLKGLRTTDVAFALDEELRRQILGAEHGRRLRNVSIKLDPAQIQALTDPGAAEDRHHAIDPVPDPHPPVACGGDPPRAPNRVGVNLSRTARKRPRSV